jgi:hypothetical protein
VVKVAATALESFRKTPLDLRDRKVLQIDPEKATKVTIATDKPATTQPTTREAVHASVVLERSKQKVTMGPDLATTMPATTQSADAATQPAHEPSKWNVASKGGFDADDTKVDELLSSLNPLRATRYIESPAATTTPDATYVLTIETTDAQHEIRFIDPGGVQPLVGVYNGLTFEVPRHVAEAFGADFVKGESSSHADHAHQP